MTRHLIAALSYGVGVTFVALIWTLPLWASALSPTAGTGSIGRAIEVATAPPLAATIAFALGASAFNLPYRPALALFLIGAVVAGICSPIMFGLAFLLDLSLWSFSAMAAVVSFASTLFMTGRGGARHAS
jgi:hypothetical protein